MLDPKSIKVVPTDEEILEALRKPGATIRSVAVDLKTHTKKVHSVRIDNLVLFPKKDKKPVGGPRGKPLGWRKPNLGIRRWLTVPKDVDAEILKAAGRRGVSWQEQVNFILKEWYELGDLNLGITDIKTATELSLKRAEFCKNMKPCPECGTEQVQLIGWPENPSWKCRHCKEEWRDEEEIFYLVIGSEKFYIPFVHGETSIQIRKRVVDYLNEHGEHKASISEHGGVDYFGLTVLNISEAG